MATYVTNEPTTTGNNSSFLIGLIILALLAVLFFMYGLPLLSGNVGGGAQVTVPETVNVQTK